jgi:hypothetical protein
MIGRQKKEYDHTTTDYRHGVVINEATKGGRHYIRHVLCAYDDIELDKWVNALTKASSVQSANKTTTSSGLLNKIITKQNIGD